MNLNCQAETSIKQRASRGKIRNDDIDLGFDNKVAEILGILVDKILRSRVRSKQKADPRQSLDKYTKGDEDAECVKEREA